MRCVSPELVLVDPELACVARELLPDPEDCLRLATPARVLALPQPPLPHVPPTIALDGAVPPRGGRVGPFATSHSARRRVAVLAGRGLVAAAVLGVPLLAFLPGDESSRPTLAPQIRVDAPAVSKPSANKPTTTASPAKPKPKPKPAPVRRAPASGIRWPAAKGASLYNVVFVRGDDRIDRWVKENRLRFAPLGSGSGASPVRTYQWFVYPRFSSGGRDRYAELLARGVVRVSERSLGGLRRLPGS